MTLLTAKVPIHVNEDHLETFRGADSLVVDVFAVRAEKIREELEDELAHVLRHLSSRPL